MPGMHDTSFFGYTSDDGGKIRVMTWLDDADPGAGATPLLPVAIKIEKFRTDDITDSGKAAARARTSWPWQCLKVRWPIC